MGGVILATLSGCQKELVIPNEFNPISRLEAEQLLKGWNTERKSTLKSTATLTLSEKQWQKAKVYQNNEIGLSIISAPLTQRLAICFGKKDGESSISFCEIRPDSLYLAEYKGNVSARTFSGYLIFFYDNGKGAMAYRYEQGQFNGVYEVVPRRKLLKDIAKDMQYTAEVVITAPKPVSTAPIFIPKVVPTYDKPQEVINCLPMEDLGGGTSTDPKPEVDTTNATFRNTKAACILAKLLGKTSTTIYDPNTVVGKLLKDYWGNKDKEGAHNLVFKVVPQAQLQSNSGNAECETNGTNNVTIRISQEYMTTCTNVELARTLIHESIHAEIYVRIQGLNKGISSDSQFAELYNKYKDLCEQRDHSIMSESEYVNLIAKGLEAYHNQGYMSDFDANISKYCTDFDITRFYEMMGWVGLQNTLKYNENNKDAIWAAAFNRYTIAAKVYDIKDCK